MSELIDDSEAIVQVASERFVELMTESSQDIMNGIQGVPKYKDARKILTVLEAYRKRDDMETEEVEALLACLYELSEAYELPTVINVINDSPNVITEASFNYFDLIIQNNGVDLAQRDKLNFRKGLRAVDEGGVSNAELIGNEYDRVVLDTSGANIVVDMDDRKKRLQVGSDPITGQTSWSHDNLSEAMEYYVIIVLSGAIVDDSHDIQFENDVLMNKMDSRWYDATKVWRPDPDGAGQYRIHALFDGTNWDIEITGPKN